MALGSGNIEIDVGARGFEDDIVRQVQNAQRRIQPINLKLDDKGFRQPLGRITGDLSEFQNSLDASVARTLAFGAAVGVINSIAGAFKGMINSATEVEKKLKDVNVILNLNSQSLRKFSSDLFAVAKNTGQSFDVVSDAAVELARQGLGAEETLKRINDAMILTRLSGMDAAKSVQTLTAAINGFGSAALTTTEIVNKLATVDAAFAVSTDDLANALSRAGATAQAAKVSMDELLGAVTSVQQTTARGGAVIGNAFKSIFTRIQRSSVREALEGIGVATTDAAGNIRNALSILQDYAQVYKGLSDGQRAYTDELIAGVFQINNLRALVKDLGSGFSIYQRATEQSSKATDQATRRNAELDKTLSALINKSVANVKELAASLGSIVASPAVKNLLNVFNSISTAITKALDPDTGSNLIKGMFGAIGKFIAGPGLILIGAAFIKLFKFITGQSVSAVKEVFKIKSATGQVAQTEAKITSILQQNQQLYKAISNDSLTHAQREKIVLDVIERENAALARQQQMISQLARSRGVQSSMQNVAAGGYIPNYNNVAGAMASEKEAIRAGVGGASKGARPKVLKNFPTGKGRETFVANTDEVVVPNYGGGRGSAILNPDMLSQLGGMPSDAKPVARGFIPNFSKLQAPSEERFYMPGGKMGAGANIDGKFFAMIQVAEAIKNASKARDISIDKSGISRYAKLYTEELKRTQQPYSKDILNIPNLFLKNKEGEISPLKIDEITKELMKPQYKSQRLSGPSMGKPNKEAAFYASMFDGFIPNFVTNWSRGGGYYDFLATLPEGKDAKYPSQNQLVTAMQKKFGTKLNPANLSTTIADQDYISGPFKGGPGLSKRNPQFQKQMSERFGSEQLKPKQKYLQGKDFINLPEYKQWKKWLTPNGPKAVFTQEDNSGNQGNLGEQDLITFFQNEGLKVTKGKHKEAMDFGLGNGYGGISDEARKKIGLSGKYNYGDSAISRGHGPAHFFDKILRDQGMRNQFASTVEKGGVFNIDNLGTAYADIGPAVREGSLQRTLTKEKVLRGKNVTGSFKNLINSLKLSNGEPIPDDQDIVSGTYHRDRITFPKAAGFIPNFATNWAKTIQAYEESMAPASSINLNTSTLGAIVGAGTGGSIKASGRVNKMGKTVTDSFPGLFGTAPISSLGVVDPETGAAPPDSARIQLGKYLTAGKGTQLGGTFPMASIYEAANKESEISKVVGPQLFDSIRPGLENAAQSMFRKVLPGQTGDIASSTMDPQRYLSSSTQGGLLEGAIRFGSDALAGEFGAADAEGAAWDFTAGGNIPTATKDTFFSGSGVQVADAKRSVSAAREGDSSLLKKTARSIVQGGPQGAFGNLRTELGETLFQRARENEGASKGLSAFAAKMAKNKSNVSGPGAKGAKSAFGGFIPNFAKLKWSIGEGEFGKKTYGIRGSDRDLRSFGDFLQDKGVDPRAIAKYQQRLRDMETGVSEQYKKAKDAEIGTGRKGAQYYRGMGAVGSQEEISTDGLFIKGLSNLIKEFNSDRFYAGGFIPNMAREGQLEGVGEYSEVFDKESYGGRTLDIGYLSSGGGSGRQMFKTLLDLVSNAAKQGNPFTDIDAGSVVGPRIPSVLVKAKKLLDRIRAGGKDIPFMKVDGFMNPPASLFEKLGRKKDEQEQFGTGAIGRNEYKSGDEKELANSLRQLGINPESEKMVMFSEVPMLQQFASGFIPNMALPPGLADMQADVDRWSTERGGFANLPAPSSSRGSSALETMERRFGDRTDPLARDPGAPMTMEDYKKTSYSSRDGYLNLGSFFPESGSFAIGTLFKDVMARAAAGDPYNEVYAGEIVGPRIPKMIVTAKKFLDKKRRSGLKQPPMRIDGNFRPAELFNQLKRNKGIYEGAKEKAAQAGEKFEPSAKRGMAKVSLSSKYVPKEEQSLMKSLLAMGLSRANMDNADKLGGGFRQDEKFALSSLPLFANGFASGFIPNFADALEGAIVREKEALREQGSDAAVYVDKDKRLKGAQNPMGLLVANTRDEPMAGSQGVDRAIKGGVNPKNMGKAEGFVPNFVGGPEFEIYRRLDAASEALLRASELMFKTFSKGDGGAPVNRESSQTRGGGTPSVDDIRDALNMPSSQGSGGSGGLPSGPAVAQQGTAEIQEAKNAYIRELNQLGAALEQEGRKLEPDVDAAKKDIGRIREVGDKLEEMGVDVKQEVNDLNLGKVNLGNLTGKVDLGKSLAPMQKGVGVFSQLGRKIKNLNTGSKTLGKRFGDISAGFKEAGSLFGGLSTKLFYVESALQTVDGALEAVGLDGYTLADAYQLASDTLNRTSRKEIEASEKRSEALEKEISQLTRSGEAIDKFISDTSAMDKAIDTGNIKAASKQLGNMIESMKGLGGVSTEKIDAVIESIGNPEKFQETTADLKVGLGDKQALKEIEKDFEEFYREIEEIGGSIVGVDEQMEHMKENLDLFEQTASKFVTTLDDGKVSRAADAIGDMAITTDNLDDVMEKLDGSGVRLSAGMKRMIREEEDLGKAYLEGIQKQVQYTAKMNELTARYEELTKKMFPLSPALSKFTKAMTDAARATDIATSILFEQAKTNAEIAGMRFESFNPVSEEDKAIGQAEFQKATIRQQAGIDIAKEIQKIPTILAASADTTTGTLRTGTAAEQAEAGPGTLEQMIEAVKEGNLSQEDMVAGLQDALENGSPDEIKALQEVVSNVQGLDATARAELNKVDQTLRKQLVQQEVARNTALKGSLIDEQSLKALYSLEKGTKTVQGATLRTRREQADNARQIANLMQSLGGGRLGAQGKETLADADRKTAIANVMGFTEGATGGRVSLESDSLEGQLRELQAYMSSEAFGELKAGQQGVVQELTNNLESVMQGQMTAAELGKTLGDAQVSQLSISDATLGDLASQINKGLEPGIAALTGLPAELLKVFSGTAGQEQEIAGEISDSLAKNRDIQATNEEALDKIKDAMKTVAAAMNDSSVSFNEASGKLDAASTALDVATGKLANIRIPPGFEGAGGGEGSAAGFVPNFAKESPLQRAVSTERAAGARPVVDHHPSIGTYVRDGSRQSNFSAVKRDHPEGMKAAISNSAMSQEAQSARGHIPNFATLDKKTASDVTNNLFAGGQETYNPKKNEDDLKFKFGQSLAYAYQTKAKRGPEDEPIGFQLEGKYEKAFRDALFNYYTGNKFYDPSMFAGILDGSVFSSAFDATPEAQVGLAGSKKHFEFFTKGNRVPGLLNSLPRDLDPSGYNSALSQLARSEFSTIRNKFTGIAYGDTQNPKNSITTGSVPTQSGTGAGLNNYLDKQYQGFMSAIGFGRGRENFKEDITDLPWYWDAAFGAIDAIGWITTAISLAGAVGTGGAATPLVLGSIAAKEAIKGSLKKTIKKISESTLTKGIKKKAGQALALPGKLGKGLDELTGTSVIPTNIFQKGLKETIETNAKGFGEKAAGQKALDIAKSLFNVGNNIVGMGPVSLLSGGVGAIAKKGVVPAAKWLGNKSAGPLMQLLTGARFTAGITMSGLSKKLEGIKTDTSLSEAQQIFKGYGGTAEEVKQATYQELAIKNLIKAGEKNKGKVVEDKPPKNSNAGELAMDYEALMAQAQAGKNRLALEKQEAILANKESNMFAEIANNGEGLYEGFLADFNQQWPTNRWTVADALGYRDDQFLGSAAMIEKNLRIPSPDGPIPRNASLQNFQEVLERGGNKLPLNLFKNKPKIGTGGFGGKFDTLVDAPAGLRGQLQNVTLIDRFTDEIRKNSDNLPAFLEEFTRGGFISGGEGFEDIIGGGAGGFLKLASFAEEYLNFGQAYKEGNRSISFPESITPNVSADGKSLMLGGGRSFENPKSLDAAIQELQTERELEGKNVVDAAEGNDGFIDISRNNVAILSEAIARAKSYKNSLKGLFEPSVGAASADSFVNSPQILKDGQLENLTQGNPQSLSAFNLNKSDRRGFNQIGFNNLMASNDPGQRISGTFMQIEDAIKKVSGEDQGNNLNSFVNGYFSPDIPTALGFFDPKGGAAAQQNFMDIFTNVKDTLNERRTGTTGIDQTVIDGTVTTPGIGGEKLREEMAKDRQAQAVQLENEEAFLGGNEEVEERRKIEEALNAKDKAEAEKVKQQEFSGLEKLRELRYAALRGVYEQNLREGTGVGMESEIKERARIQGVINQGFLDMEGYQKYILRRSSKNPQSSLLSAKNAAEKRGDKPAIKHYGEKLALFDKAADIYGKGRHIDALADFLYRDMTESGVSYVTPLSFATKGRVPQVRKSDRATGKERITELAKKFFIDVPGLDIGRFQNIDADLKEEIGGSVQSGEFSPREFLEKTGFYDDKNQSAQFLYSKVENQEFVNDFKKKSVTDRIKDLELLGLGSPDQNKKSSTAQFDDVIDFASRKGEGSEQFKYLLENAKIASERKKEAFAQALKSWSGDSDTSETEGLGMFSFLNKDGFQKLSESQIGVRAPGSPELKAVDAFSASSVPLLERNLSRALFTDQAEGGGSAISPEGEKMRTLIFDALANKNIEELRSDPRFMVQNVLNTEDAVKSFVQGGTDRVNNIENFEDFRDWNTAFNAGLENNPNLPSKPKGYGRIDWQRSKNPQEVNGFRSAFDFYNATFGNEYRQGNNKEIEALYKNIGKGFYTDALNPEFKESGAQIKSDFGKRLKNAKDKFYAPFGYQQEFARAMPAGANDPNLFDQAKALGKRRNDKPANEAAEAKKNEPIVAEMGGAPAVKNARGFIPNFSAIAAEISAASEAGYAKNVTASQVRTMNIPGQGTTSYNTQESVIKGAGMRQPFIVPPADSKAAPEYSKKVQKKFGFSPYNNAADGFVPNLAPSTSPIVKGFMRSLDIFGKVLLGPVQLALEASTKDMQAAAKEMKEFDPKDIEVDTTHLDTAVGDISAAMQPLADLANTGITLNDGGLNDSVQELTTAMSNIQGRIEVDPVKVTVETEGGMAGAIENAFINNITPRLINLMTEIMESKVDQIRTDIERDLGL